MSEFPIVIIWVAAHQRASRFKGVGGGYVIISIRNGYRVAEDCALRIDFKHLSSCGSIVINISRGHIQTHAEASGAVLHHHDVGQFTVKFIPKEFDRGLNRGRGVCACRARISRVKNIVLFKIPDERVKDMIVVKKNRVYRRAIRIKKEAVDGGGFSCGGNAELIFADNRDHSRCQTILGDSAPGLNDLKNAGLIFRR